MTMTADRFTYWLQGHVEMNPHDKQPTEAQWAMIKEHLQLVFKKVTKQEITFDLPLVQPYSTPVPYVPPFKLQDDGLVPPQVIC